MEENLSNNSNITQTILNTINSLFNSLFSSIDNNIYGTLDDLAFINTDILRDSFFEKIFGTNSSNGILLIANSLLIAFTLYYCFKLLYANFTSSEVERPYQFIFKLIIFGILMNFSFFICENFIYINSLISSSIREIGENIFGKSISFSALVQDLNSVISIQENTFNIFSFDGLIKSFISLSLFNLLFSYSLRYIMIKGFIIFVTYSIFYFSNLINYFFLKFYFYRYFF